MPKPSVTPMMSQFIKLKSQYTDALLFYRMGDFYELFFEDAKIASSALNITLTKRGKYNGQDIPMCGVPFHSSENYLQNLIRKGHKVAVCEQLEKPEDAKKRGYKEVVKRDVVRVITPGTLTEDGLLSDGQNNFLLSCIKVKNNYGVAWTDISTGEFYCSYVSETSFLSLLNRIHPSEILIEDNFQASIKQLNINKNIFLSSMPLESFDPIVGKQRLEKFFNVKTIDVYGDFNSSEISSMAALIYYLEITQCTNAIPLMPPVKEEKNRYLTIDSASRQSLEITKTLRGELSGSLLGSINKTLTSGGSRLLSERLNCPSTNLKEINNRQETVGFFVENQATMANCRDILKQTPDMQRALSRIGLNRGTPKDLGTIRNCLRSISELQKILLKKKTPFYVKMLIMQFKGFEQLLNTLNSALVENPTIMNTDANVICSDYNQNLKKFRQMKYNEQTLIIKLQATYINITKINSLKIKYNNVLGYFIETPIAHLKKMPPETFIHRQTTTNSSRFTSLELSDMANNILNAQENATQLENKILKQITEQITQQISHLNSVAVAVSEIDLYSSLGFQSVLLDWIRPKVDQSNKFEIKGGRHPVIEETLRSAGADTFVANDCNLCPESNSILLITGPNMAGKSTYLRQNALIVILAQIGSYVPAQEAHIGVIDQIFSRVGASDDLSKGNSTFMVEMIETASILKKATKSSLIMMDEIGRGTSTYDGLSIAWATLEHIHNVIKCRTLFATHYHELTNLQEELPLIKNATVTIREWQEEIIFLHQVQFGTASKSYGIQVAKLAGLPNEVINRSKEILNTLESTNQKLINLPIVNREETLKNDKKTSISNEVFDMLLSLNTDEITPKQALNILDDTVKSLKSTF